jgi:hypothetical protein
MATTRLATLILGAVLLMLSADAAIADTVVTTCGQSVTGPAVLEADLDCSAASGPAVVLANGGSLSLGGFTLTAKEVGVQCIGRCGILGPGTIRRTAYDPGWTCPAVVYSDCPVGVLTSGRTRFTDVTLENWGSAIQALAPVKLSNTTIQNCRRAMLGSSATVIHSTITNNAEVGVFAGESTRDGVHFKFYPARVLHSTVTGNGVDIEAYKRPKVVDSTCVTSGHLTVPPSAPVGGDEWGVCG